MNACTIIAKNYLPQARVLAESFRAHHPDGRFYVLVLDDIEGWFDPAEQPFETVTGSDLDLPDFERMASAYDVLEMSTAVKPWFLRQLLEDNDHVVYLDPDIRIYDSCDPVVELARSHGMVLTPHNVEAMPRDGRRPSEADILIAGAYNLGFIALSRREATEDFLSWWSERLREDCIVDVARGYFVDQRWMDLVPAMIPGVCLLRDPGYNVAYWNLYSRSMAAQNGSLQVNGHPLRFFHFSGYDPDRPDELSRHQNRVRLIEDPLLKDLCDEYGDALRAHGYDEAKRWPYSFARTASGMVLDRPLRRLYADGLRQGVLTRSVFDKEGERRFQEWAREPAGDEVDARVNRWMLAVRETRPDLQAAFPLLHGPSTADYLEWLRDNGIAQLGDAMRAFGPELGSVPPGGEVAARPTGSVMPRGVNVVGYLSSELGVGEVGRQVVGALDTQRIPVLPVGIVAEASRQAHHFAHAESMSAPFSVNLLCVNADQTPIVCEKAGEEFFAGRYTVGWWWWEVSTFPEQWHDSFRYIDELWAGSHFVAESLAAVSPVPVVPIPMPVTLPERVEPDRPLLGLPDDFIFLFVYDYNSVADRKNPLGLIDAYKRAFELGDGATLLLKCINGERHRRAHAQVQRACAGRSDIVLMDHYMAPWHKDLLIASCDCYVSLHRSEGFGITLAEAMLLGKPVIATGYSGNVDFMSTANSYPVDYHLVPIGVGAPPYPAHGRWAEPDLDHAAAQMRAVFSDRAEAARRAAAGREWIREHHSPEVAGQAMGQRLEHIAQDGLARPPLPEQEPDRVHGRAREITRRGPVRWPRGRLSPMRFLRAAVLRANKPVLTYEREVHDAIIADVEAGILSSRRRSREAQLEGRALMLADMRRLEQRLTALEAGDRGVESRLRSLPELQDLAERMRDTVEQSERLMSEMYAPPYIEGKPFREEHRRGIGKVLAYTDGGHASDRYREFEDTFRGSEDFIRERQRRYIELVAGHGPVVDAGCGRGEFLDLLREASIDYVGVDLDEGMVKRCRMKGHEGVYHADIIEWLDQTDEGSVGAVFSAQVVEHMPYAQLLAFLAAARRALHPDGLFIAETVNPHSFAALRTFWVDLTHQLPIFPEVLLQLCRGAGFEEGYVFMPNGKGDYESDRRSAGEYAVVASAARTGSSS
jgi:glycosyltransferase involved in cell wall biosynthesis